MSPTDSLLVRAQGFTARRTGCAGDGGVDVWLANAQGDETLVQCKSRKVRNVSDAEVANVLRQFSTVRGVLFTNQELTPYAQAVVRDGARALEVYDHRRIT